MPENIQLFIADPCHEQWDDMQPNAEGRYCGSCQKTVVDFSMMSDQEVLSWFSGERRSVCGRFAHDQLNRELVYAPALKRRRWVVWWQFLLAGWLMSSGAFAQGKVKAAQIEYRIPLSTDDALRIRVVDVVNSEPIPWASVQWKKGRGQRMTDAQGWFTLSRKELKRARQIEISAIGHVTKTFDLEDAGEDELVRVLQLSRAADELPAVTVESYGVIRCRMFTGAVTTVMGAAIVGQKVERSSLLKDTLAVLGLVKKPFIVYPNPVARGASVSLSLQQPVAGNYVVQLFSAAGSLVESMRIEGVNGARTELLTIPGTVAAGLYFVRLQHEQTGKVYMQKVEVL